jgi:hypothetical protein
MAVKRDKQFCSILQYLDKPDITEEKLKSACAETLRRAETNMMACRHQYHPSSRCYRRGTCDGRKAPCVRRSNLERWLGVHTKSKSHLRAYHLAFIAKATTAELRLMKEQATNYEVRHLCGHIECDNPEHLKLGTVNMNEVDKHYHYILDTVREPQVLLEELRRQLPVLDIV